MSDPSGAPSTEVGPEFRERRRRIRPIPVIGLLLTLVGVAVLALFFRPQILGGPITNIAVSGNSMLPTFRPGDFLVVKKEESYAAGDIVVFVIPADDVGGGQQVVHRIVGGDEDGFVMRGDNNPSLDPWNPTQDQIVGQVWLRIPGLAGALSHLRDPLVLAILIGSVVFGVLAFPTSRSREAGRWTDE